MEKDQIQVNILEMIRLNEIKLRNKKMQLDTADSVISLFKKLSELTPETSTEELEETQSQLRAMMNKTEEELKIIQEDKKFVKILMDRGKK